MRAGKLFIGWCGLSLEQTRALDLDQMWHWESFDITWAERGVSIAVRVIKKREF